MLILSCYLQVEGCVEGMFHGDGCHDNDCVVLVAGHPGKIIRFFHQELSQPHIA